MTLWRWLMGSLYRKYVLFFTIVVTAALLISGVTEIYSSYHKMRAVAGSLQREKAHSAALQIEHYIQLMEQHIRWTAFARLNDPNLQQHYLDFVKLLRQAPAISEVSWLDAKGREQLKISRHGMDRVRTGNDRSKDPSFVSAKPGMTYFGPVYFRKKTEPYMTIGIPVQRPDTGVIVAEVNLTFIWEVTSRIRVGTTGYAYVVDRKGRLVSHPDIGLVLRRTDMSGLPQVHDALADRSTSPASGAELTSSRDLDGRRVLAAHAPLESLGWMVLVEQPATEAYSALYASLRNTALLLILGFVISVGASVVFARRMVTPIRVLQAGAARIREGAFDHRFEVKTGDELEKLGIEFNHMADSLRESYAGLELKVAERTHELAEANREKSRFLAAASHDLRQPLHALGLFVAALDEPVSQENRGAVVKNINRSLHALEQLFNSLLDISKLDAGVVKPEIRDAALTPLLDRLSSEYEPQARAKGLVWFYRAAHAIARTDSVLLETVLRNLIGNAIRYTKQGEVRLTCVITEGCVQIEVADTGIGIPPEQQQEVFREFVQLHNPERDRTKGLGLGLAIVDRLTKLLDHPLQMESAPGHGSTFVLELPCGDERLADAAAQDDGDALFPEESPLRVLIIEDEVDAREALATLLKNWGHEVMAVASPDEATSINGPEPDAIITDYRLREEATGSEAIRRIRRMWSHDIPALIVTGDTAPERLRQAQQGGFALLHKPVSPGKLRAFLRGVQRERSTLQVG